MPDRTYFIDRSELEQVFSLRSARAFEELQRKVASNDEAVTAGVDATTALAEATFVTLSANDELPNERVLSVVSPLRIEADDEGVTLYSDSPIINGGFPVVFSTSGPAALVLPLTGTLATLQNAETLKNKTLDAPKLSDLGNYADDTAAAVGGIAVGGVYRNGSVLMVRVA